MFTWRNEPYCITLFKIIVEHVDSVPEPIPGLTSIQNGFTWNKSQQSSHLSAQQELIEVTPG